MLEAIADETFGSARDLSSSICRETRGNVPVISSSALARLENGSDASKCAAPASMSGRPLSLLSPESLLCGSSLQNVHTDTSNQIAVIVSVVLVCACAVLAFVLVKCECKEKAFQWRKHEDAI